MFNREQQFKKDESLQKDARTPVTVAGTSAAPTPARPPLAEPPKPEAPARPARESEAKGSKLIVGPDIKLKGAEITDCDTLVVEGRVEAAMDSRVIQIAEQGVFSGTVGIDIAEDSRAVRRRADRAQASGHPCERQGLRQGALRQAHHRGRGRARGRRRLPEFPRPAQGASHRREAGGR